jgi:superfamily II DNA or RNA helicase
MPLLNKELLNDLENTCIREESMYDTNALRAEHEIMHKQLNAEQQQIYEKVINAVRHDEVKLFLLYRYGGTGKTFVCKTIINKLISESKIILTVASLGNILLILMFYRNLIIKINRTIIHTL